MAKNKRLSVAVIEAGGFYELDAGNLSQIPAYESLYENAPAAIDWGIYTTPHPVRAYATSVENKRVKKADLEFQLATRWSHHTFLSREMSWGVVSFVS